MASIYLYNETSYGEPHADQYLTFLDGTMDALAQTPNLGKTIDGYEGVRLYLAKSTRRKQSHGYRIFFREVETGIEIIRVLHTRMNWEHHLGQGKT